MKTKIIFIGISVFLYAFLNVAPASADVIISEFSIGKYIGGKATSTNGDDFVELYNTGDKCVPLEHWKLRKRIQSSTESSLREIEKGKAIMPGGFFLWVSSGAKPEYQKLADTASSATLTGNGSIALFDSNSSIKDSVIFGDGHINPFTSSFILLNPGNGLSNERDLSSSKWKDASAAPNPTGSASPANNDRDGDGCPDPEPAPSPAPTPSSPISTAKTVRINEIFPNPKAKSDAGEFIELYNFGGAPVDISGWILRDATKTGKYVFPAGTLLAEAGYLAVTDQSFKLALNNSDETISLFDDADALIDSVRYEKTKEDISLDYTVAGWRGGAPTPGGANSSNNLPETKEKVPKKGYLGAAVDFDARGKDTDHDTLKYTWDFGDGHKSYKEKTSHAYEENGTYAVALTTNDGKDDTTETFTIEIRSFPHPEVRIVSLMPNPEGSDTDNEWIMIENREKKTVNLKDYGIATGWKSLSNHPIRENFLIEAKKEAKVTRAHSLFTLPNQKGKIELRAPDGKVLQEIKYKLEESIAENAVYQKKKGQKWRFEESVAKNTPAPDTPPEAGEETHDDALVLGASDRVQDRNTEPAAENAPSQTKENIQDQLSLDPDRPLPQEILAYGTRVELPDTITLTPPSTEKEAPFPEADSISLSLAERLGSSINTSLNGLLNDSQEQ